MPRYKCTFDVHLSTVVDADTETEASQHADEEWADVFRDPIIDVHELTEEENDGYGKEEDPPQRQESPNYVYCKTCDHISQESINDYIKENDICPAETKTIATEQFCILMISNCSWCQRKR